MSSASSFLARREPNFENLLKVLRRQRPDRPTLFEFFLNIPLYQRLAGPEIAGRTDRLAGLRLWIHAFQNAGYDYSTVSWDFKPLDFPKKDKHREKTISLNEGGEVADRISFQRYPWPTVKESSYAILEDLGKELPAGMKLVLHGPGGVLENTISLVGYETLCLMIVDEPDLAQEIFDAVGARLLDHYRYGVQYDSVGAIIANDDWGYKTQPMLSPDDLRRFVFPWHKRIVQAAHEAGKPAILHSCGNFSTIFDDIADDMRFDGRHSYEDAIIPVEDAYEKYGPRMAIMGGIDVDFLVRSTPAEIYRRSKAMLERAATRGGFALGSGNSIPEFVPQENYLAMIRAAME